MNPDKPRCYGGKKIIFGLMAFLLSVMPAMAQGPAGAGTKTVGDNASTQSAPKRPKKQLIIGYVMSGAACGIGIGLSANPATAAEIGLPILVGGNILATKLYQKHPKWSGVVQTLSPLGCAFAGKHVHKPAKVSKPSNPNPPNGGGNPPNPPSGGGNPPSGGGNPPGGGSGGGGNGGNGGGNGGNGGSGGGHGGGPCIQDCGTPGNGGVNTGNDGKKPPFPGVGRKP